MRILSPGQTNHISPTREGQAGGGEGLSGTQFSCPCLGEPAGRHCHLPVAGEPPDVAPAHLIWRDLGCLISPQGHLPCLLCLRAFPSKNWRREELHQWFSKCVP